MNRNITLLLILIIPCLLVFFFVKYLGANDPALSAAITCALAILPTIITAIINNKSEPVRVISKASNPPAPTIIHVKSSPRKHH